MKKGQSVPTGVKIIAILHYIGAAFAIIFGLLLIVGAGIMDSLVEQMPLLGALGTGLFIVGGILIIGFGVLSFFIGRGLWKAKSWARIVAIIFAVLGIISVVVSMVQGNITSNIFSLGIQLVIGGYLLFSKKVKKAFA